MSLLTETGRDDATAGLLDALGRLIRTSRALGHRQQSEFGLSGTPFGILRTLETGDLRAGDLAVRLQVAPSVVSRALIPLEQAALVERRPDPADARACRLGLTDRGRDRLTAARQDFLTRFAPLLDGWTQPDIDSLTTLMTRLESTVAVALEPGPHAS